MNFPEWAKINPVTPEVAYAGVYLERHGQQFGENFQAGEAIDKASKIICDFFDETEDWEHQIRRINILGYSDWT
jgi:hypothetical protein